MKPEYYLKLVTLEPFNDIINVVFTHNINESVEYLSKINGYSTPKITDKKVKCYRVLNNDKTGSEHHILAFNYTDNLLGIIRTISHESFHCLMYVASIRGATWSNESDEMFAYALDKLIKNVFVIYTQYQKKLKTNNHETNN